MKFVVILNAPPLSGKDTLADIMCNEEYIVKKEFKTPLFDIAKSIAQVSDKEWEILYLRKNKDKKSDLLNGRTPREHMIYCSEHVIKPNFGNDYFGKMLVKNLDYGINLVSDGGFKEELDYIVNAVGSKNVMLIRIHRDHCSFNDDSRNYLYPNNCASTDISNNSTINDLVNKVDDIINSDWNLY